MTRDEAIAAIATLTPLTASDLEGFLACSDDERRVLIETYRDAGVMPSRSAWDVVLDVLKSCAETAALVIPITGAIGGVFGLVKGNP